MSEDLFKKNASQWVITCPRAAADLLDAECCHVTLCQTGDGEWNISRKDGENIHYYHSPEGALEEAKEWFDTLDLRGVETLFVYGVGLGYYYQAAKEWLAENKSRAIIFLEDDLEVIHLLFETQQGKELLSDRQVRLQYFQKAVDQIETERGLFSIPIFYFMTNITFSALGYYAKKYSDALPIIERQLDYIKNCKGFQIMEYMNYGETFFKNFYRNVLALPSSYLSDKMFGHFKGVPAIICGAGPSLEKNLPILEELRDRAVIFAGGSSLNSVSVNGFLPHFGVSIDPNWNQYARLFMNQAYEVPFFYRNRIFPQALSLVQGDRLYVPGSGGHKVAEYFEKNLEIEEEKRIPEGNNVVNFSLSIAEALGCNPIIFVGVDLAYTDNRSYSTGVRPHPILDANKEVTTRGPHEEIITKRDIYGEPVNTLWKWISESMWITQFAVTSPRTEFINATEGGIGFEGIKNMSLKDVAERYLSKEFDFSTFIHGEIQSAQLPKKVTKENIIKCMGELQQSLIRCENLCAALRREFHHVLKEMRDTQKTPQNLITENALQALKELNNEIAYENVLSKFNSSFMSFFGEKSRKMDLEIEEGKSKELDLSKKRVVMNKKRYEFLKAVCGASLDYIKEALEAEKLTDLVSEAFGKQIEEAIAQAEDRRVPEEAHVAIYEKNDDSFRIIDDEMNLSIEEKLEAGSTKVFKEINEYVFSEESTRIAGCYQLNYPSGSLKMEQYFKDGRLHGPSSYYSEAGTLLGRSWFVEGVRQGKSCYYYFDGSKYCIQRHIDGKLNGVQEFYYPEGRIKSTLEYKNGKLDGSIVLYYSDGFKKREVNFSEGKRHGLEIVWNIGGIKEFEGSYQLDRPVGVFRSWYAFGNIAREITYDNNGNVIDVKGWDIDGTPLPSDLMLKKDYFDVIQEETSNLTSSLETVYNEVESMTRDISKEESLQQLFKKFPDFTEELKEIKKELDNLKLMNIEMGDKAGEVSKDTSEALWKNPETRRIVGEQIKEATQGMAENIKELEDVMRLTIQALAQKKPESEDKNEKQ